jgi:hypothetical protein
MNAPLPLAAAQARLGKPGRPRTRPPVSGSDGDKHGDKAPDAAIESAPPRGLGGRRALAFEADARPSGLLPRLLTVEGACHYLSLKEDTVLELLAAGTFQRVTVPAPVTAKRRGGAIRKVLLDRVQLDAAVTAWTRTSAPSRAQEPR